MYDSKSPLSGTLHDAFKGGETADWRYIEKPQMQKSRVT